MWASIRAVVVLPLVPVIAAIGIRVGVPGGNSMSITGPPTSRGRPSLGAMCMRNPGAALISQMAPPTSLYDSVMSVLRKSTPPTSRPIAFTARTAISMLSGCTWSVTSVAVPPVERLPVERRKTRSPVGRHRLPGVALLGEQGLRLVIELEPGEHLLVPDAAAGILVHLVHQLLDGVCAVSHHVSRNPQRHRHQLAVDHQHPVVLAGDEALDDDAPAVLPGDLERLGAPAPRW